ncbi:MAG: hypothetical protein WC284_12565 [Candidimonas sp.]
MNDSSLFKWDVFGPDGNVYGSDISDYNYYIIINTVVFKKIKYFNIYDAVDEFAKAINKDYKCFFDNNDKAYLYFPSKPSMADIERAYNVSAYWIFID